MAHMTPMLFLALTACAPSVIPLYEAARNEALSAPGPAPKSWEPDATLFLSHTLIDEALATLLAQNGAFQTEIGGKLLMTTPELEVTEVVLKAADCDRCVRVIASLDGAIGVRSPLIDTSVPVNTKLRFDAVFDVDRNGEEWLLIVQPQKVISARFEVGGTEIANLTRGMTKWLEAAIGELPPVEVAKLGSPDLPIRGLRVVPIGRNLRLDLLTETRTTKHIVASEEPPADGWRLDLSTDALVDLARVAAFNAEALPLSIVAEPTSLLVEGGTFTLGLRLWRIKGRGWWRTYEVTGDAAVRNKGVVLTPLEVVEVDKSQGAAWADPLLALGHGIILKTLENAINTSVPAIHRQKGGNLKVVVQIAKLEGSGDVLSVEGQLDLAPKKGAKAGKGAK